MGTSSDSSTLFQSLQGTIRSPILIQRYESQSNFNLSKVQLEVFGDDITPVEINAFQSLQGTIRRSFGITSGGTLPAFQSLQGTIRRAIEHL